MGLGAGISNSLIKNGVGFTAVATGYDFFNNKAQGETTMKAAGSAIATAAISATMPWYMTAAIHGAPMIKPVAEDLLINSQRRMRDFTRSAQPFSNAQFVDNTQKYTMRQAGMAQIEQAEYDQQNAMLGREAKYMNY